MTIVAIILAIFAFLEFCIILSLALKSQKYDGTYRVVDNEEGSSVIFSVDTSDFVNKSELTLKSISEVQASRK